MKPRDAPARPALRGNDTLETMPGTDSTQPAVAASVLEILRCPATFSGLIQRGDELVAVDDESIRYPIIHHVPRLLTDSA